VVGVLVGGAVSLVLECLDDSAKTSVQGVRKLMSHMKKSLPVHDNSEEGASKWGNPVNPVMRETAVDNGWAEGTGWVDAGCEQWCISKCRPYLQQR